MPSFDAIIDTTRAAMSRLSVPGVALAILHGGTELAAGLGVTRLDDAAPVSADTPFQIGSISKTFTATMLMQLSERGAVDWKAPVRRYLPDFRLADESVAARVTVEQLVFHRGGWRGDYFPDTGNADDALATTVGMLADLPQVTPLGALFSYNNAAFYIAGRIVEVVTGQTYEAALRELLLVPLGMSKTCLGHEVRPTNAFAHGHSGDAPNARCLEPWALGRAANPVGGIVSNVSDLMRYARLHLSGGLAPGGRRLLAEASVREMQIPRGDAGDMGDFIGLSWRIGDYGSARTVGHGGATHGQMATFQFVPGRDVAVVVLTNGSRGAELHGEVSTKALAEFAGLTKPVEPLIHVDEATLDSLVGRYEARLTAVDIRRDVDGLKLQLQPLGRFPFEDSPPRQAPPAVRLALTSLDWGLPLDPPLAGSRVGFVRGAGGVVVWVRFGGRLHRRV
jgi:CubicO group peptidase (beta-lactamase class C family)